MRYSITYKLIFIALTISFFMGCVMGSEPSPVEQWKQEGLTETQTNVFKAKNGVFFAGTDDGVFKKSIGSKSTKWTSLGLDSDTSQVVDIIVWNRQELMAAVNYDEYHSNNDVILKTEDGGKTWQSYTQNFVGENINNYVTRLALGSDSPNTIYVLGGLPVARSTDRGLTWRAVFKDWRLAGFGKFIKVNSNTIWAGGAGNIFSPYLVKSEDGGETWTILNNKISTGSDGTCYDAILHPQNANHVLVAMNGIRRTTDGGETWKGVFNEAGITTFAHSARNPKTVYASGQNPSGTVFFAASTNFGDSWQIIEMEDSPAGIQVNDMVSVMVEGKEVLYLGTNKGVYSYRFEE